MTQNLALTMNDYIVLESVVFVRGARRFFGDVSLRILRGKIMVIMDLSGAGKPTLLRLIGGQFQCENDR